MSRPVQACFLLVYTLLAVCALLAADLDTRIVNAVLANVVLFGYLFIQVRRWRQ